MRKLVIPKYYGRPSIGLALFGCTNRPFYHVCVFPDRALGRRYESNIIEQVGTFDPLPNKNNEKLVALNYGRLKYWIGERNAHISVPVLELLGLSGLFPIHPKTFIRARDNREAVIAQAQQPEGVEEAQTSQLVFFFVICYPLDDSCFNNVKIYHDSNSSNFYDVIGSSSECVNIINSRNYSEPKPCPPNVLTMSISPIPVIYSGNMYPDVRLNFSVLIFERVESVDFRLQCLLAPNHEDTYCHDSSKMIVNNVWLWPCRMLRFHESENVSLPFQFGYSCFRIFGLSQYMANVTLQPQNCRSSLIFTAPDDAQLFPEIAKFYNADGPHDWSPMLFIDLNEDNGIWIRIEKPANVSVLTTRIDLFKRIRADSMQLVESFDIEYPNTGVKWFNAHKGDYVAYAYVPRHDCRFMCPQPSAGPCSVCQHTTLNFTLSDSKGGFFWKSLVVVEESGIFIVLFMAGVFVVALFGVLTYLYFLKRKSRNSSVYVELVERPTVLILYSHDTDEHCQAVLEFSKLLSSSANASVLIDTEELIATGSLPSRWLVDSLSKASYILLILSPASEGILNGRKLVQRKPFPDMFSIACDLVIKDCTTNANSKSKFATVRFLYSPQIVPYHLQILNLQNFEVPQDLALLTGFLHRVGHSNVEQDMSSTEALSAFNEAVRVAHTVMINNPDYINNIWETDNQNIVSVDIDELPTKEHAKVIPERVKTAKQEGLLSLTDEDSDGDEFKIIPMSESEDSDKN